MNKSIAQMTPKKGGGFAELETGEREYSSKPLKHSTVKGILVFKQ